MTTGHNEDSVEQLSLDDIVERIRVKLEQIESYSDPSVRRMVFDLLDLVDAMHREGLVRLAAGLQSAGFFDKAIDDPFVSHLFSIYDLFADEGDVESLVEEALEEVRPYVHSHGGEIEVAGLEGGILTVKMFGACAGCPSSVVTLTQSVERAVRSRWPSLIRVEVDDHQDDPRWQSVSIRPNR